MKKKSRLLIAKHGINTNTQIAFKLANTDVIDFYKAQKTTPIPDVPVFNPQKVVDGERKIVFLKQLPTSSEGRQFEVRTKVIGVYDKGKASVVETEFSIVDKETDEVYSRMTGSSFFVGQGGWGGPKGMLFLWLSFQGDAYSNGCLLIQSFLSLSLIYRTQCCELPNSRR